MANYDSIDLDWTWDGDFQVDTNGDLKDTSNDLIRSLINEIATVAKSETGDWEKNVTVGANLSDFQGEPNIAETGLNIQRRLKSKLVDLRILQDSDVTVTVTPVHINQVLINVIVTAQATSQNQLTFGELLRVSAVYDTIENSIFFLLDDAVQNK